MEIYENVLVSLSSAKVECLEHCSLSTNPKRSVSGHQNTYALVRTKRMNPVVIAVAHGIKIINLFVPSPLWNKAV